MKQIIAFILLMSVVANCATIYDSYVPTANTSVYSYSTTYQGQTFTASASYVATTVSLQLWRLGTIGEITVKVYSTSSGLPTGDALATGTYAGDTITTSSTTTDYVDIAITPVGIASGTSYAIVVQAPSAVGGSTAYLGVRARVTGAYSTGTYIGYDGSTWSIQSTIDLSFKVSGNAITARYVSHSGSNMAPYATEAQAGTNIQTVLTASASGDTVWIKNDTRHAIGSEIVTYGDFSDEGASWTDNVEGWDLREGEATYYDDAGTNDGVTQSIWLWKDEIITLSFDVELMDGVPLPSDCYVEIEPEAEGTASRINITSAGHKSQTFTLDDNATQIKLVAKTTAGTYQGVYIDNVSIEIVSSPRSYLMDGHDQQASTFNITTPCSIKGYYQSVGDLDEGGACYKHATYGWTTIDGDDVSAWLITVGNTTNVGFCNLKFPTIKNASCNAFIGYTNSTRGHLIQNCYFSGYSGSDNGFWIDVACLELTIADCEFVGLTNSDIIALYTAQDAFVIVENNNFNLTYASGSCVFMNPTGQNGCFILCNNRIYSSDWDQVSVFEKAVDSDTATIYIKNNSVYVSLHSGNNYGNFTSIPSNSKNSIVSNNIIVGTYNGIHADGTGNNVFNIMRNNCFWNITNEEYTGGAIQGHGDIIANPQFRNPAAGDFTPMNPSLYNSHGVLIYGSEVDQQVLKNHGCLGPQFGNPLGN